MRCRWILLFLISWPAGLLALDREAFTVTRYDLDLHVEPAQQRLGARGKIVLRNDSSQPQKVVALQVSSSLNWRAVRMDGKPLQFVSQTYTSDIDHTGVLSEAIVTLPATVEPKSSVELEIGYEGVIAFDATRLTRVGIPKDIARHTSWDQIGPSFTTVRGAGYVAWYPITTESADFSEGNSLFEVVNRWKARVAQSEFKVILNVVPNGDAAITPLCSAESKPISHEGESAVGASCSWKPLGIANPMIVIAGYKTESKPPLNLYILPGHEAGASKYSAAFEPAAQFVSTWFGKPATPVAIADFADSQSAPFESGNVLLASMAGEDTKLAGINLVHELVHSAILSSRPWVTEGLAHFGEALYREQQGGRQAALDLLGLHRAAFLDAEKELADPSQKISGQPLVSTFDEIYYRSKAAYVWWMLRDMVGDDALQKAIARYRAADDNDPRYVQKLVEAASKRDLGWFFDDWVYQDRGLPDLRVQSVHPWNTEKGTRMITVTLENLGPTGAEVSFTVHCTDNDVTRRLVVRGKNAATTRVELTSAPLEVIVNDGSVPESDLQNNTFKVPAQ